MVDQRLIVEVVLDLLVEEVGFADKEVGAGGGLGKGAGPFRVAGAGDDLVRTEDAQRISGSAARVHSAVRGHFKGVYRGRSPVRQLHEVDTETLLRLGRAR